MTYNRNNRFPRPANRPTEGEMVLFCRHADLSRGVHLPDAFHWFYMPGNTAKDLTTGDEFDVEWLCICQPCFFQYRAHPEHAATQNLPWIGEPPSITGVS